MAQLMPLPLTVSCFSKIQMVLPFWYQLTWVDPDKGPLNVCVCVCVLFIELYAISQENRYHRKNYTPFNYTRLTASFPGQPV